MWQQVSARYRKYTHVHSPVILPNCWRQIQSAWTGYRTVLQLPKSFLAQLATVR